MNIIFLLLLVTGFYGFPRSYLLYFVIALGILISLAGMKKRRPEKTGIHSRLFILFICVSLLVHIFSFNIYNSIYGMIILLLLLSFWLAVDIRGISESEIRAVFNIIVLASLFQAYHLFFRPHSSGTFTNHAIVALMPVAAIIVLAGKILFYREQNFNKFSTPGACNYKLGKILFYREQNFKLNAIFIILSFTGLALARSRAAFFSLPLPLLYFLYKKKGLRFFVYTVILLSALAVAVPSRLYEKQLRLDGRDPYSGRFDPYIATGRMEIWKTAWQGIKERPLSGWGIWNFDEVYGRHSYPVRDFLVKYPRWTQFVHNEHLQVFVETGVFAFLLYSLLVLSVFRKGLLRKDAEGIIACGVFAAIFFHAMFNMVLHTPFFVMTYFIFARFLESPTASIPRLCSHFILKKYAAYAAALAALFFTFIFFINDRLADSSASVKLIPFSKRTLNLEVDSSASAYGREKTEEAFLRLEKGYKKYLSYYPAEYDCLSAYAATLYSREEYGRSMELYRKLTWSHPKKMFPYLKIAEYEYNQGHRSTALEYAGKALSYEPNFAGLLFLKGLIQREQKDAGYKESFSRIMDIDLVMERIKSDQQFDGYSLFVLSIPPEWYNMTAGEYYKKKDYARAKHYMEKALAADPGNRTYRRNLYRLSP